MKTFLVIILIIAAVVALGLWLSKRRRPVPMGSSNDSTMHIPFDNVSDDGISVNHDLMKTRPGDMLSYTMDLEKANKIVVGVLECKQSGSPAWLAVLLDDGVWLSFEPGARGEFNRWQELPREEVAFPSGEQLTLEYGGVTYHRNDFGYATYVSHGDTGLRGRGELEFAEFRALNGEKFISFERYDDNDFTLSVGEKLLADALSRFPADDSSI